MHLSERAQKVHSLPKRDLIYVTVSHVLVLAAVVSLLLLNLAVYYGYDPTTRAILALWSVLLLLGSYVLYRRVKSIDFLDYMGGLVFYHRLRSRWRELDATNTLLFFGLLLISLSPFLYTYLSLKGLDPTYSSFTLFLGGIFVAMAVSGYVLLEEDKA